MGQTHPKPIYRSKTFGVATLNVVALHVVPGAKEWVAAHPEAYAEILTVVMITMRYVTNRAVKRII